jgi:hypothetical protein
LEIAGQHLYGIRAEACLREGQYVMSFTDYDNAIELNPGFEVNYANRSLDKYCTRDYDQNAQKTIQFAQEKLDNKNDRSR